MINIPTWNTYGHKLVETFSREPLKSKMSLKQSGQTQYCSIVFFEPFDQIKKSKDIFYAKMAYGQQHFLVWFFTLAAPLHTLFSDVSLSIAWSFIRKKL